MKRKLGWVLLIMLMVIGSAGIGFRLLYGRWPGELQLKRWWSSQTYPRFVKTSAIEFEQTPAATGEETTAVMKAITVGKSFYSTHSYGSTFIAHIAVDKGNDTQPLKARIANDYLSFDQDNNLSCMAIFNKEPRWWTRHKAGETVMYSGSLNSRWLNEPVTLDLLVRMGDKKLVVKNIPINETCTRLME